MHYTLYNQIIYRPECSNQLLLGIKGKGNIGKSQVIKAISRAYDIIDKINSIFIIALTRAAANNISESTLHTVFGIDIRKTKEIVKGHQKIEKTSVTRLPLL